jgi:2-dehydropantoate 2-reductase
MKKAKGGSMRAEPTVNVLLVGTGAIGSFYGGHLQRAGAKVAAVCRSDYEVVSQAGIAIKSPSGDFHFMPDQVVRSAAEYSGEADYIVVSTKVLPGIDVPSLIAPAVSQKSVIVLLQNGIDIEQPVVQAFPDNEVITALAFICVVRTEHGQVEHQDYGRIAIGRYPQGTSAALVRLASLFHQAGVVCSVEEDAIAARWTKLVWNAPFNPVSVLAGGATTRQMLSVEATRRLIREVMVEVVELARAAGHPVDPGLVEKNLQDTLKMTPYKTSMLHDFENKRPLEVEAILGNALRLAGQFGVAVPHIESLYGLLLIADRLNRGEFCQ